MTKSEILAGLMQMRNGSRLEGRKLPERVAAVAKMLDEEGSLETAEGKLKGGR